MAEQEEVELSLTEDKLLLLIEAALWLNKFAVEEENKELLEDLISDMEQLGAETFGGD